MYRVGLVFVDFVDYRLIHIGEYDMVTSLFEYRTDKSSTDVAGSELNCFFHGLYFCCLIAVLRHYLPYQFAKLLKKMQVGKIIAINLSVCRFGRYGAKESAKTDIGTRFAAWHRQRAEYIFGNMQRCTK